MPIVRYISCRQRSLRGKQKLTQGVGVGLAGQILNRRGASWHRSLCPSYLLPSLSSCLEHGHGDPEDG